MQEIGLIKDSCCRQAVVAPDVTPRSNTAKNILLIILLLIVGSRLQLDIDLLLISPINDAGQLQRLKASPCRDHVCAV